MKFHFKKLQIKVQIMTEISIQKNIVKISKYERNNR